MKTKKGHAGKVRTEVACCMAQRNTASSDPLLAIIDLITAASEIAGCKRKIDGPTGKAEKVLYKFMNAVELPRVDLLEYWSDTRGRSIAEGKMTAPAGNSNDAGGDPFYQLYVKADQLYREMSNAWTEFKTDDENFDFYAACEDSINIIKENLNQLSRCHVSYQNRPNQACLIEVRNAHPLMILASKIRGVAKLIEEHVGPDTATYSTKVRAITHTLYEAGNDLIEIADEDAARTSAARVEQKAKDAQKAAEVQA